jgi:hypothetical protein
MSLRIKFTSAKRFWRQDGSCRLAQPYPAKFGLPKWYKELPRMCPMESGEVTHRTVKMCPPFLEAMSHGYVIPAPFDFELSLREADGQSVVLNQQLAQDISPQEYNEWCPVVGESAVGQLGSAWRKLTVFQLRGYWQIETPDGFSSFCIQPLNHNEDELPFHVIPCVADTDTLREPVTLSIVPKQPPPIAVKEGTPLVQIIPFERCEWNHRISGLKANEIDALQTFHEQYMSPENRQFDKGADASDLGYGAYHKLVKDPSRFE